MESLKAESISRTTKAPSSKYFREALNFSKLQLISQLEHEQSNYAYEIYSLTHIESEYVSENVASIQTAIEIENNNMEQFVDDLRRAISDESYLESLLRDNELASESTSFAASIDNKNTSNNSKSNLSKSSSKPLPISSSNSKASSGSIVRAALQAKREGSNTAAQQQPKVILKSSSARFPSSSSSNLDDEDTNSINEAQTSRNNNQSNSNVTSPDAKEITPRTGSAGGGRFRNRLKDAQAELYFADD